MGFLEAKRFDELSVDADQSERLVKLLDAVVIKLEGGTDLGELTRPICQRCKFYSTSHFCL